MPDSLRAMALLNPLYLLGLLAVAVPVYLHLRKRPPLEEQAFPSLAFLEPSPEKKTRRRNLDELMLLLLRCAMLALLALLFARPFFRNDDLLIGDDASKRMLILVDASASMKRGQLWDRAVEETLDRVGSAKDGDEVAISLFSDRTRALLDFNGWRSTPPDGRKALARQLLDDAEPNWSATEMGRALMEAAERIQEVDESEVENGNPPPERPGQLEVHLIGDLQSGGGAQILQSFSWPEEVKLIVEELEPVEPGNASLHLVGTAGHPGTPDPVRVRIANDRLSPPLDLSVKREDTGTVVKTVHLKPGASRVIALPDLVTGSGSLLLTGDAHDFDNRVFYALPEPRALRIVVLGDDRRDDPNSPLFYLERAFPDAGLLRPELYQWNTGPVPIEPDLIVVLGAVPAALVPALKEQVEIMGHRALCVLTPENEGGDPSYLPALGAGEVVGEGTVDRYALLQDIDFDSLLLQPFADARTRDFTRIRFWKHRQWRAPESARILARFDNGAPAWASLELGAGRIYLFTAGWQPGDSQLALSTKFVPLLHSLVREAGTAREESSRRLVGDALDLGDAVAVTGPDGTTISREDFTAPDHPGLYLLESESGTTTSLAIHLNPRESETAPLGTAALTALGTPAEGTEALAVSADRASTPEQRSAHRDAEFEGRQKIWRWLLFAVLLFFLAESWRAGRRPTQEAEATSPT